MSGGDAASVHHVGITVADLDEAIEFFSTVLGVEPLETEYWNRVDFLEEMTGYDELELRVGFFEVPGNGVLLELIEYMNPKGATYDPETYNVNNSHVSFLVKSIDREFDRLRAAGVQARSERPVTVPEGPYTGAKFAYLRGPSGLTVELAEFPEPA